MQLNGPVWPFETSKVATAMINLLQTYPEQPYAGRAEFDQLLRTYEGAHAHAARRGSCRRTQADEQLHPDDGYWITRREVGASHSDRPRPRASRPLSRGVTRPQRTIHPAWHGRPGNARDPLHNRGDHYFHSSFNDLVLGSAGLRPADDYLEVYPLSAVRWFAATAVKLRGRDVAVVWDADGKRFPHGAGLHVWVDGLLAGSAFPLTDGGAGGEQPRRVRIGWDMQGSRRRFAACSAAALSAAAVERQGQRGRWWDC